MPWLASPSTAGVVVDFDGTLAPIVAQPDQARPHPAAVSLLSRLADRYAVVAVVSGRPRDFLSQQLEGAGSTELIGLYGMDRGSSTATDSVTDYLVAAVADAAEAEAPDGVFVERKGKTVTLHYRADPAQAGWAADFAARHADASGLLAHPGKMSVELTPARGADKGTVVAELAVGLDAICFIGDDRGDLPAFAELGRIRLSSPDVTTLAVAVAGDETPTEVLEAADLIVSGPDGVVELLSELAVSR